MDMNQDTSGSRKKVLFVITKSNFGGAQRYVYDLATNLPADSFEVAVAFGGTGEAGSAPGTLATMLAEAGIHTILVPELARDVSIRGDMAAYSALVNLFKEERPDVVHLNSSKVGGIGSLAARFAGIHCIIFTAHGWPFWEQRNFLARSLIFLFSYLTVIFSHATICISQYDQRAMTGMPFARRKLHVIHNGISEIPFLSRDTARAVLFSPIEINSHEKDLWLLSIGELTANKNYIVGIDAVATYNATASQKIFYAIIGNGEQRQEIERYIASNHLGNQIKLLGFIPDGRRYMRGFDIFFLPSKKEGVPYVILEAGLADIPVIASNVGGIPEIIDDGKSGLLVGPGNTAGFTQALKTMSEDMQERGRKAAALRSKIASDFSLQSMLEQTIKLY